MGARLASSSVSPRIERALFWALVCACLVPVWLFPYYISQDGGSHLESANILLRYGSTPLYQKYLHLNWVPVPNWFGHVLEAALLAVFPPPVAEKVFVSLYVIGFALALRLIAGYRGAMLATPLILNCLVLYGFYNFLWSMVWLAAFAAVYRWASWAVRAALLVVIYFCHLFSSFVAGVVGLLFGWKRITVFAPVAGLMVWYVLRGDVSGAGSPVPVPLSIRWAALCRGTTAAFSYAQFDQGVSTAYAVLLLLWCGWHLKNRRWNVWALVAAVMFVVYLFAPPQAGTGGYILERCQVYVLLALALWAGMEEKRWRWLPPAAGAVFTVLAVWNLAGYQRELNAELAEYLSVAKAIEPGKTILPVQYDSRGPGRLQQLYALPMRHAGGYLALRTGGLDLTNYEARLPYFPIQWREEFNPGVYIGHLEDEPPAPDYAGYGGRTPGGRVDYVLVWDPLGKAGAAKLPKLDRMVAVSPKGWARLYRVA